MSTKKPRKKLRVRRVVIDDSSSEAHAKTTLRKKLRQTIRRLAKDKRRGGAREGAGRPVGRPKGRVAEFDRIARLEAAASGELPLAYMLRVMRDPEQDPARRDEMAKAAAPYVHAKLTAIAMAAGGGKSLEEMIGTIERIIVNPPEDLARLRDAKDITNATDVTDVSTPTVSDSPERDTAKAEASNRNGSGVLPVVERVPIQGSARR